MGVGGACIPRNSNQQANASRYLNNRAISEDCLKRVFLKLKETLQQQF
jgi:hypothetical protein